MECYGLSGQFGKFLVVDIVHVVAAGGESDVHIGFGLFYLCAIAGVEQLQVGSPHRIVSYVVQYADKCFIGLAIDSLQFDGYKVYLVEDSCREKIGGGVETVQYFPFISFHHRFQLKDVTYQ